MATIYDIAKLCNTSATTVSYVLNGTGTKHRISEATQENVRAAAQRLNYLPNTSARNLSASSNNLRITVLWPEFFFEQTFISGMHAIRDIYRVSSENIEINIAFFIPGRLSDKIGDLYQRNNGIVLLGAAPNDLEFLSTENYGIPIVIANRSYNGFPSVSVDNQEAGRAACDLLCDAAGDTGFISVWDSKFHVASSMRQESFIQRCAERNMSEKNMEVYCDGTSEGGYHLGISLLQRNQVRKAIFCNNESAAVGLAGALQQNGIQLGKDVLLLSTNNGPSSFCKYHYPPISAIELKMEEVLTNSLKLCLGLVKRTAEATTAMTIHPDIVLRDSFPG